MRLFLIRRTQKNILSFQSGKKTQCRKKQKPYWIMEWRAVKEWTVSDYYRDGYTVTFGQLVLVEDGIHWAREYHAQLAWDFMKQFCRNEQGMIEQIK